MNDYSPPFRLTDPVSALAAEIKTRVEILSAQMTQTAQTAQMTQTAQAAGRREPAASPRLRRENRIRTIHASLSIEQNSLTLEQVTAVLDGKRVLGNPVEIREVRNAWDAYELMFRLDPLSVEDLLTAHCLMMAGLIAENGRFRRGGVGVFNGDRLVHMAPPADLVPGHVRNLLDWYGKSPLHPLIKSAVFYYEFEFIHPFADGNGRMGRMWHTMLLGQWRELFYWLPVEELIKERQEGYYAALGQADREADSTAFVGFMLEVIRDSLEDF